MAQIILRGDQYYSDFRFKGRRIRRPLSTNKREAQIELGKLIEKLRQEGTGKPSLNISWADYKVKYLTYCDGSKKAKTATRDRAAIKALERDYPITQLSQVKPEILDLWKSKRLKAGYGKTTVNRDISAIKALMKKAASWGYALKHDWSSVKEIKIARRKLYFYSPKELSLLLSKCRGVWRTICLLGARSGLRREEIHMLTWEDIDFTRNRLHVVGKDGWEPKDYEERFIPLAGDLRAHLEAIRGKSPPKWVCGDPRPVLDSLTSYMRKISRKVGLKGSINILRHTFASHLVQAGVPLKTVKDLMGHSSMETTEIYAELIPENFEDAVSRLPVLST